MHIWPLRACEANPRTIFEVSVLFVLLGWYDAVLCFIFVLLGNFGVPFGGWVAGFLSTLQTKKSLCVFVSLDPSEAQKLNKPVWDVVAEQMHIYIFIYIEMPTNSIVQYQM